MLYYGDNDSERHEEKRVLSLDSGEGCFMDKGRKWADTSFIHNIFVWPTEKESWIDRSTQMK